jgi:indole-3-glycerol phosphate synthase
METILDKIIAQRHEDIKAEISQIDLGELRKNAEKLATQKPPFRLSAIFRDAAKPRIIAEFKRKSPSRGVIRQNAEVASIVAQYEKAGAAAISVLTESRFFEGNYEDLVKARKSTRIPILQKDFFLTEYQIYNSVLLGADAILLLANVLAKDELCRLKDTAEKICGLDVIVEVHTESDLLKALECQPNIIGVNNRNLATFEVSLENSRKLIKKIPYGTIAIAESGISDGVDVASLYSLGYKGFLIGESLMKSDKPDNLLSEFLNTALQSLGAER